MQSPTVLLSDVNDRDLEQRIATSLADRHVPGLRQLEVAANNGTVTLRGRVRKLLRETTLSERVPQDGRRRAVCRRGRGGVAADVSCCGR